MRGEESNMGGTESYAPIAITSLRQMASKQADRRQAALNAARQNGVASASESGEAALLFACFLFAA